MVWHVSQAGLHKDHYSSSHTTGGPGDSGDVQLSPLPVSFHKSVGGETPVGKVHLDGHSLTRFTVGVNKIAGAKSQYQFNEGALSTISENRPLMGSTARECRMQGLVGNGSPAAITP